MSNTPEFDRDGYPTDATLDKIAEWSAMDLGGLLEYIGEAWSDYSLWRDDGETVEAITGGWSGNESLIGAFHQNFMAWNMSWQLSERGGRHVFKRYVFAENKEADHD